MSQDSMNSEIIDKKETNIGNIGSSKSQPSPPPKKQKSRFRKNVETLGMAFLLPVSLLPIAGIFLGIGSAFTNLITNHASSWYQLGLLLTALGNVAFTWMPLFFAVTTTLAFTKNNGFAAFSAAFGYLIFAAVQSPFIDAYNWDPATKTFLNANVNIFGWHVYTNLPIQLFDASIGGFLFFVNSSVFGGIIVGLVVAWTHNRFGQHKLPTMFSFFDNERFVPIMTLLFMIVVGMLFLFIWPIIGQGLVSFGKSSAKWPFGIDSFVGNFIERILTPFGLNNLVWATFFWTDAGGTLTTNSFNGINMPDGTSVLAYLHAHHPDLLAQLNHGISGDQKIWLFFKNGGIPFNLHGLSANGINPGRYMDGRFPFMMFGLTGAGIGIIAAAKQEHRKVCMGVIGSGILTCFITGTTQPLEFAFLFACPFLFWGPHSLLVALSGLVMNVIGAHLCGLYSGGLIDYIIYPVSADFLGLHAGSYWAIIIGIPLGAIYFCIFYFYIKIKRPTGLVGQTAIGKVVAS